MKISVLTATYNRANLLNNVYQSLLKNSNYGGEIEWLIMDDGSTDNTEELVRQMESKEIEIKYFKQENQGKMVALNKLVPNVEGELIVDCDSDDYFTDDAFKIIKQKYQEIEDKSDIYALGFLKKDHKGDISGKKYTNKKDTLFRMHYNEDDQGEKVFVFITEIRKKYKHKLEHNEKFITEARMYYEMENKYHLLCYNEPIEIIEYQEDGYTKNIKKLFIENPFGYHAYFKEILEKNMKNVKMKKRIYAIKQYILFSYLTKQYDYSSIKEQKNKFIYFLLFIPGILKSRFTYKK